MHASHYTRATMGAWQPKKRSEPLSNA
jgi:hypothetical protein